VLSSDPEGLEKRIRRGYKSGAYANFGQKQIKEMHHKLNRIAVEV